METGKHREIETETERHRETMETGKHREIETETDREM